MIHRPHLSRTAYFPASSVVSVILLQGLFVLTLVWMLFGASPALSLTGSWHEDEHARLRLLLTPDQAYQEKRVLGGLHFVLQPGWKSYWRSPGAAGLPPRLTPLQSENIAAVDILFPAPTRFVEDWGLETFGYKEEIIYPLAIQLKDPTKPARLKATVDYMVCADICVPYSAEIQAAWTPGDTSSPEEKTLLARYTSQLPAPNLWAEIQALGTEKKGEKTLLRVRVKADHPLSNPDLFVEGPDAIAFPKPEVTLSKSRTRATFLIPYEQAFQDQPLEGEAVRLTLVDTHKAVEFPPQTVDYWQTTDNTTADEDTNSTAATSLWSMLLLAFLGGLILNVMPCVLPVLSLKIIGVIRHSDLSQTQIRASFLASATGILTSFLLLALIAFTLQQAGMLVGWGMHFQQPAFILGMALVILLFAANLWGLFEIRVGHHVTDKVMTTIDEAEAANRHWGHFLSGMFATLLATPCTAPILGTAIGFALSGSSLQLFSLFFTMGLGLAAPYLLVALTPSLARLLPRPGRWMNHLKHLFGLLLCLTSIWLFTVFFGQVGLIPTLVGLTFAMDVLALLWLRHQGKLHHLSPRHMRVILAASLVAAIAAPLILSHLLPAPLHQTKGDSLSGHWVTFDESRIPTLVAEGKTVFVDVTADWCINCKFNKLFILQTPSLQSLLTADDVITMEADWTGQDETIGRYLKKHGRYGIPFNIVYGPGAPEGVPLPELLSEESVTAAFAKARGTKD